MGSRRRLLPGRGQAAGSRRGNLPKDPCSLLSAHQTRQAALTPSLHLSAESAKYSRGCPVLEVLFRESGLKIQSKTQAYFHFLVFSQRTRRVPDGVAVGVQA